MDELYSFVQAALLVILAYGCYLCLTYRHLSDREGIEREFGMNPDLRVSPPDPFDPMQDKKASAEVGLLS